VRSSSTLSSALSVRMSCSISFTALAMTFHRKLMPQLKVYRIHLLVCQRAARVVQCVAGAHGEVLIITHQAAVVKILELNVSTTFAC
jgi:hypothetical protein